MADNFFDVVVIGAGPGGYVAAIRSAQLGMKTAVVEANHLGGICLNWGCIPTKALLRSAEVHRLMKHADEYGLKTGKIDFDLDKIVKRSRGVSEQLSKGVAHLLNKNKVTIFDGRGKLNGKGKILVQPSGNKKGSDIELSAKHIILATGARARVLPGLEPDGKLIWTYKEALVPESLPSSMLIVGSGAIGSEFASFYNEFGVKVTIVEVADRILPVEDEEISSFAHKQFEKQGINIITKATVTGFDKSKKDVTAHIKKSDGSTEDMKFDRVIMAVGVVANTEDLGLENTKVKLDRGHIVTDEWLQTGEPGVYAIGDVTAPPWLAHKASHEAVICVEKFAGEKADVHPLEKSNIPGCTYTHPQIASVGLSEKSAIEKGYKVKVGRFPFMGNGKAIALGEPEGLVKTIFDEKTGELLGAHMIGAEVTELVQGFGIAKELETTELELMHTVFAHPTLSEMIHESVLDAYGKVIHY